MMDKCGPACHRFVSGSGRDGFCWERVEVPAGGTFRDDLEAWRVVRGERCSAGLRRGEQLSLELGALV